MNQTNDKQKAEQYRQAAEQGDAEAIVVAEAIAVQRFRKAAEQGQGWGQYNLGECYLKGTCVSKDEAEAVKWFRKAAEQDDSYAGFAQYELGRCYIYGWGVPQDIIEAEKWLRAAAQTRDDENIDTMLTLIELTRKEKPENKQ